MKIVIVEDDQRVREELQQFLQNYGYEVAVIEQFQDVVGQLMQLAPQLILLDVNLPTHDGYTICREWRKQSEVPIIIVTSRSSDVDELMSMHLGADDFITKPFNTQILMARIEAILKRTYQQGNSQVLTYHDLQLDVAKGVLSYQNEHVTLTKNELIIFQYLVQNQGTIVARESLMEYLWSTSAFIDDNTLSVNVTRLRKKIEGLGVTNPIETRRGLGYLLP
ncbi:MAG: response regulator transcription factor [Culicoidibacterales bacterium]